MKKSAVLLVNLGSPDSPSVTDVRKYLREFLMDERVLDTPFPIRFGIVNFGILPTRPKESAEAYHKVWQPEGSPLVVISRRVQSALRSRLNVPVELAMRYQNPSVESAVKNLVAQKVTDLLLIPMFPHYAMSSYETAVVRVREVLKCLAPCIRLQVVEPCYNAPDYIDALTESSRPYLDQGYDHLLFSFHGLPERHLRKSDTTGCHCLANENCCNVPSPVHKTCYRAQCFRTVEAFVEKAGVTKYSVSFQSRLGKDPWLAPATDTEIQRLAKEGVGKLLVICPAFVADCLETLEEIGMRGKETFLAAGGSEYAAIPCLNTHPRWLTTLENMAKRHLMEPGSLVTKTGCSLQPA